MQSMLYVIFCGWATQLVECYNQRLQSTYSVAILKSCSALATTILRKSAGGEYQNSPPADSKVVRIFCRLWYDCGQTKNHRRIGGDFS